MLRGLKHFWGLNMFKTKSRAYFCVVLSTFLNLFGLTLPLTSAIPGYRRRRNDPNHRAILAHDAKLDFRFSICNKTVKCVNHTLKESMRSEVIIICFISLSALLYIFVSQVQRGAYKPVERMWTDAGAI